MAVIFGVIMISPFSGWLYGSYSGRYTAAVGLGFITAGVVSILFGLVTNPKQEHLIPLQVLQADRAKKNDGVVQSGVAEESEKEAEAVAVVAPVILPSPKRPTGVTIMCILWILGGLYNFFFGLSGFSVDLNIFIELSKGYHYSDHAIDAWVSWAIPTETVLIFVVVILGIMQFATVYGLWNRRNWSYKLGIAIPVLAVVTSWSQMFLALTAPSSLSIMINFAIPFLNTVFAIVYILYLRRTHVKEWLRVNVEVH